MSTTTILLLSVDEAPMLAHSLPAALAQAGAEVVVVDNASTDSTPDLATRLGARHLRLDRRRSYAAALNLAIAATAGDAVLLLNADCILEPSFLTLARPRLDEPGVGSVAPMLLRLAGPDRPLGQLDTAGMIVDRRRKNGLVRSAAARCSTRTWSCGPRTPTSRGGRGCTAGGACMSRGPLATTSAPTAPRPAPR